ncbi:hypothetical protein BDFB_003389 [Asbolus verrucosus]|uniref:Uncharacterized protein n=1 Tax=Asbolus verrucosus TaxID=1661398 RepID=A0A482V8D5_ASBVE|nr:hypothetical protein BDFB_003389 [Asbolus verrucosus]
MRLSAERKYLNHSSVQIQDIYVVRIQTGDQKLIPIQLMNLIHLINLINLMNQQQPLQQRPLQQPPLQLHKNLL